MNNSIKRINAIDMLLYSTQRWRFIITCMIIGAILVGLFGVYKRINKSSSALQTESIETMTATISDQRKSMVEYYARLYLVDQQLRDENDQFIDDLYVTKMDPNRIRTYSAMYYVDNHQEHEWNNDLIAIVNAYALLFSDNTITKDILEIITQCTDEKLLKHKNGLIKVDTEKAENGIFTVRVTVDEEQKGLDSLDEVDQIITEHTNSIQDSFGTFEITSIGQAVNTIERSFFKDYIISVLSTSGNYNIEMGNIISKLENDNENKYFNYLIENGVNNDTEFDDQGSGDQDTGKPGVSKKAVLRIAVKYGIIGLVLGLIAAYLLLILKYVFSNTLKRANEPEETFEVPNLIRVEGESAFYKKRHTALDKKLRKIRQRKNMLSVEESLDLAAVKIRMAAEQNGYSVISIVSDYLVGNDNIVPAISDRIGSSKHVLSLKNILADPETLQQLQDSDCVVLIEQIDNSYMGNIAEEIKICKENEKPVLGTIVLV